MGDWRHEVFGLCAPTRRSVTVYGRGGAHGAAAGRYIERRAVRCGFVGSSAHRYSSPTSPPPRRIQRSTFGTTASPGHGMLPDPLFDIGITSPSPGVLDIVFENWQGNRLWHKRWNGQNVHPVALPQDSSGRPIAMVRQARREFFVQIQGRTTTCCTSRLRSCIGIAHGAADGWPLCARSCYVLSSRACTEARYTAIIATNQANAAQPITPSYAPTIAPRACVAVDDRRVAQDEDRATPAACRPMQAAIAPVRRRTRRAARRASRSARNESTNASGCA